jgi:5-methylcytosine-specific restriction endonuclease McrA
VKQPTPTVSAGAVKQSQTSLVTRSTVPAGLRYAEYRPFLRRDFFYSCAYCTICESEATTIAFTIDHYEPQSSRPDLTNEYSNLMYSCITCNVYKGDLAPPPKALASGVRHFRPDHDARSDHFELNGVRLNPKSPIGEFSIETIELNRLKLRKLRDLRRRLANCDALVSEGVRALRRFRLDELPSHIKGKAAAAIGNAAKIADKMASEIDAILGDYARSPMADTDPEAEARAKERAANLRAWQQLYPGSWRARTDRTKRGRANSKRRS